MKKTIGSGKRFLGVLINGLVCIFVITGIINIIFALTKKTTVGGIVAGYSYKDASNGKEATDQQVIIYFLTRILAGFLYAVTFTIMLWVNMAMRSKTGGTFGEKWAGLAKR